MQCEAKTEWVGEQQCEAQAAVHINGMDLCLQHAGKEALRVLVVTHQAQMLKSISYASKKRIAKRLKTIHE